MTSGLVSTIIPVYNRPQMLREAVESVLAQTYRPIEVIIVDDGSTDETPRVASELAAREPDVVQVFQQSNAGPGAARNTGLQSARGEFIQYLDSDDVLRPRKFDLQVAALCKRPECGIAYGYTRLVDHELQGPEIPYRWTGRDYEELFPALLVDRWWSTHTPLYRRTVCDKIGGWSKIRWGEDWEYEARAGGQHTRLVNVHEFVCDTRMHDGLRDTSPSDQTTFERLINWCWLQEVVLENALLAGITIGTREMIHFSRVQFMLARYLGRLGHKREAQGALRLGYQAAGNSLPAKWDLVTYEAIATVLGWRLAGQLSAWADRFRRKAGGRSLLWSWAKINESAD